MANGLMPTSGATPTPNFSRNRGRDLQSVPVPGHPGAGMGGGGPSGIVPPQGDAGIGAGIASAGSEIAQGATQSSAMKFRAAEGAADRKFHLRAIERKHELDKQLQQEALQDETFANGATAFLNTMTGYSSRVGEIHGMLAEGGEVPEALTAEVVATVSRMEDAGISVSITAMESLFAAQAANSPQERSKILGEGLNKMRAHVRWARDPQSPLKTEDGKVVAAKMGAIADSMPVENLLLRLWKEKAKQGLSFEEATKTKDDMLQRRGEKVKLRNRMSFAMINAREDDDVGIRDGVTKRGGAIAEFVKETPLPVLEKMGALDILMHAEKKIGNGFAIAMLNEARNSLRPENFRLSNYLKTGFSEASLAVFDAMDSFHVPVIQGLRDPAAAEVNYVVKDENGDEVTKRIAIGDKLNAMAALMADPESQAKLDVIERKFVSLYAQYDASSMMRTEYAEKKITHDLRMFADTGSAIESLTGKPLSGHAIDAIAQRVMDLYPDNAEAVRLIVERSPHLQSLIQEGMDESQMMEGIRGR